MLQSREDNEVASVGSSGDTQPTVFSVLATHARQSSRAHLLAIAVVGGIDAAMVTRANPALWWVAAAFVSFALYGCWGFVDRALVREEPEDRRPVALLIARAAAVVGGCIAALAVILGLMGSALSGWIL